MPDISMCKNEACPKKEQCYRYKATSFDRFQTWAYFEPDNNLFCEYFMSIGKDNT